MSEVPKDLQTPRPDDAQQLAEEIASGEQKAPEVNLDDALADAKAYSVSEVDRTGEGAEAAVAATAPKLEVPKAEPTTLETEPTGNPDQYREMAKDLHPTPADTTSVSDDLLQKALEKGQPGS
ncbi:hypothetical protein [Leptolyngbya sp. FACHB-261]|uniref:hypothetical protein n=1 Tax=Leptolyngbya sp. FACHB-261 TaxID=2692806 RepID=UPI001687C20C|nr:hypothetical protein [Leptolyngbya sp. FACHB-261]MBD2102952.1 hypothetical protein [Leptolyngbya sp. FACHB-261]